MGSGFFAKKIFAYNLNDKSRDSSKDFNTLSAATVGNNHPHGIWSDGTTMWVADTTDDKVYAYKMIDKSHDPPKDFDTTDLTMGNDNINDIWSNGLTMWVLNGAGGTDPNDKIYAYDLATKAYTP